MLGMMPSMGALQQDQTIVAVRKKAPPCVAPTMTYRWAAYNPSNLCTGSVACTDGAKIITLADFVSTNNGTQATDGPIYHTNQINGQPALTFLGIAGTTYVQLATSLAVTGSATFYAVLRVNSGAANSPVIGVNANGGIEWDNNGTPNYKMIMQSSGVAFIGTETTARSLTNFTTVALTYNFSTGAYVFYDCSGGTCTADGSGTTTASWTGGRVYYIGLVNSFGTKFDGQIAEVGYLSSSSTTGIGAYSQCKYGI